MATTSHARCSGAAAHFGMRFVLVSPPGYALPEDDLRAVSPLAEASGATIETSNDPIAAVRGAQVIYTDVWVSMGMDADVARRRADFTPYQVNAELLAHAPTDAIILHDLPAHRGEEITDEVADGPQSLIFPTGRESLACPKSHPRRIDGNRISLFICRLIAAEAPGTPRGDCVDPGKHQHYFDHRHPVGDGFTLRRQPFVAPKPCRCPGAWHVSGTLFAANFSLCRRQSFRVAGA